jgi:hypothetical protein
VWPLWEGALLVFTSRLKLKKHETVIETQQICSFETVLQECVENGGELIFVISQWDSSVYDLWMKTAVKKKSGLLKTLLSLPSFVILHFDRCCDFFFFLVAIYWSASHVLCKKMVAMILLCIMFLIAANWSDLSYVLYTVTIMLRTVLCAVFCAAAEKVAA